MQISNYEFRISNWLNFGIRTSHFALPRVAGNWTFVVVTDRVELDDQIAKTFKATGAVSEAEGDQCHAASIAAVDELTRDRSAMLKRQIQNLRRTRDLLLPRLLSGQVELSAETRTN